MTTNDNNYKFWTRLAYLIQRIEAKLTKIGWKEAERNKVFGLFTSKLYGFIQS